MNNFCLSIGISIIDSNSLKETWCVVMACRTTILDTQEREKLGMDEFGWRTGFLPALSTRGLADSRPELRSAGVSGLLRLCDDTASNWHRNVAHGSTTKGDGAV